MYRNDLYHWGVKGMRWGVRKKSSSRSADSANLKRIRKKKVKEMTNQELKEANNRLNLEKNYRDLKKSNSRVKKFTKTFVATAGTITAVTAAAAVYKKTGSNILNKIGDWVVKDIKF